MSDVVTWRYDHTTESWLRWALLAGATAVFGVSVGVAVMAASALLVTLVGGSLEVRLLVVVLALVGGPFSLLYLAPILRDPDQRPRFRPADQEPLLSNRTKLLAGLVGAPLLGGSLLLAPLLAAGLLVAGLVAGLVGIICSTRGTLEPESATLDGQYREWDLDSVRGYRTVAVGPLTIVWLRADSPGSFGRIPSWFLVPTAEIGDVTAALDTVRRKTDVETGRDPNTAVRVVASLLAVTSAAASAAAVLLGGFGHLSIYGASMGLLFAGLFVVVAREG